VQTVNWAAKAKLVSRLGLLALTSIFLSGCEWAVMDPKGPIGVGEKDLILLSVGLMLIVVIPVILMTLAFAWRYRASNTKATYSPNWSHSTAIEVVVWTIPCIIILILGTVTWFTTHSLDPRQPIASNEKPLEVDVVSLDWKWLFIYPEYGVASVNELAMPVGRTVHFKLTSSGVMNAFFVPQLGTQVYTMPGMQSLLNLRADHAGTYEGMSANYSGHGFADMHFAAKAMDAAAFKAWVAKAKQGAVLDQPAYIKLMTRGTHAVTQFGKVGEGLYYRILNRCAQGGVCTDDAVTMARMKDQSPGKPFCAEPAKPIQSKIKG
jgi:cytochrome o ubiquinol oxidase subunit 2